MHYISAFTNALSMDNVEALQPWYNLYGDDGMQYIMNQNKSSQACNIAAQYGNLSMLQYLHQNGFSWSTDTPAHAASNGHLDCLKYLYENGCPWNTHTCRKAVNYKQVDCLRYAHENGCPFSSDLTSIFTSLACLQYLYENGCEWDSNTCRTYALGQNIERLTYVHERGAPWDKELFILVRGFQKYGNVNSRHNYDAILQYMRDQGCPGSTMSDVELTDLNGQDVSQIAVNQYYYQ